MNRVIGKRALVTGGGSGIGRAVAHALSREGARVLVTDRHADVADTVASELRALGAQSWSLPLDVTDETAWQHALGVVQHTFGGLDVLVNNAGIGGTKSLLATSLEDWRAVLSVNLDGVFLGTRTGIEAMRRRPDRPRSSDGSIINISSVLGLVGMAEAAPYCASKGGVRLLTKVAALEAAAEGWGVRVNSVHPGFIRTPMLDEGMRRIGEQSGTAPAAVAEAIALLHPLGRLGQSDEVAAAVLYLASDEAAFVTGSELVVDGGYSAR